MRLEFIEENIKINGQGLDYYLKTGNDITRVHKMVELYNEKEKLENDINKTRNMLEKRKRDINTNAYSTFLLDETLIERSKLEEKTEVPVFCFTVIGIIGYSIFVINDLNGEYTFATVIFSIILGIICASILFKIGCLFMKLIVSKKLKSKRKLIIERTNKVYNNIKLKNEVINQNIEEINSSIDKEMKKLILVKEYIKINSILSDKYNNYYVYSTISNFFIDGRADSIKEALNLFEVQQHYDKILDNQRRETDAIIAEQKRQTYILEEEKRANEDHNKKMEEIAKDHVRKIESDLKSHMDKTESELKNQNNIIDNNIKNLSK